MVVCNDEMMEEGGRRKTRLLLVVFLAVSFLRLKKYDVYVPIHNNERNLNAKKEMGMVE